MLAVDVPHRLEFQDGFADDDGNPDLDMPTSTARITLSEQPGGGTRMAIESVFPSTEAMEQLLVMGAEEGMVLAMGQIDELLMAEVA